MSRSGKRDDGFNPERIVTAAVDAFLGSESGGRDVHVDEKHARRRRGGAVALGVIIGIGTRALYRRAREFDLERAARAVEKRMVN
ncbi:MAG TPA: hypothetical protein VE972_00960 [Conexibacter sp.]|nr:hypothetical protein [Conexibacter sp.]